ncbi:hypothetical protein COLO4_23271 [Corchorus olitorius]|uniref:Uncharacterized protein n=1 Tax=Corchorus olitorius TaxID=93759 RepID=A0A1R3IHK1_9ROSI|nr:hypothetical protein COLO4_23271 [Corchorus olitorius]
MATDQKAIADHHTVDVDTQSYNTEENRTERSASSHESTKFVHFSKALAHRAVYGGSSSRRSSGTRKIRSNDARTLPSRLSKVSLADDDDDSEN